MMSDPGPTPTTPAPLRLGDRLQPRHRVPAGTHVLGMWLFLAALAVLFLGGMLVYILVRLSVTTAQPAPLVPGGPEPPPPLPLHAIDMPLVLWLSTAAILLSSYTIHRALDNIIHERQQRFRQALLATLLLAVPFFLAQGAGLASLLGQASDASAALSKAVVFLIIVHALHVVGGLIPLIVVTRRAHAGRYDHEVHAPVKHLTMYWHFLDIVWLLMFATFVVLG